MMCNHAPLDAETEQLAASIGPDVLQVLNQHQFFARLEATVKLEEPATSSRCNHTYHFTDAILVADGFSEDDRKDIEAVFRANGGFCDCEVLFNVDDREESPRVRYWRRRALSADTNNS